MMVKEPRMRVKVEVRVEVTLKGEVTIRFVSRPLETPRPLNLWRHLAP